MNFTSRSLTDHVIEFIYDVENIFLHEILFRRELVVHATYHIPSAKITSLFIRFFFMSKIPIEIIAEALNGNNLDQETISKVMNDIAHMAQVLADEEKAQREPVVKKQFILVLSDPRGTVPDEDYVGWVVQIPEDDNPGTAIERIKRSAYEYNISKKGRKYPVKSIGEACEAVGAKFQKEQNVAIKTKLPVTILKTDNVLPKIDENE